MYIKFVRKNLLTSRSADLSHEIIENETQGSRAIFNSIKRVPSFISLACINVYVKKFSFTDQFNFRTVIDNSR